MSIAALIPQPADVAQIARTQRLADLYAISEIDCHAVAAAPTAEGVRWLDIRPMTDPREYPGEVIDMHQQALQHALDRHLIVRHPLDAHLVRIARRS